MITVIMAASIADNKTLNQFDALVMPLHQETDELFVNIPSKTFAEEKKDELLLNDEYFIKAMNELRGKKVYQLRLRKSQVTDSGLDVDALKIVTEGVNNLKKPHTSFLIITELCVNDETKFFGVGDIATVFSGSIIRALCLKHLPSLFGPFAVNVNAVSLVTDDTNASVPSGQTITSPSFNSCVNLVLTPVTAAVDEPLANVPVNTY